MLIHSAILGLRIVVVYDNFMHEWYGYTLEHVVSAIIRAHSLCFSKANLQVLAGASLNMKDNDAYTALHWACHEGEGESVAILMDVKANINEVDFANWTPLMLATHVGCNDACQILIDSAADLLRTNNQGQTAYDLAREGALAQEKEQDITDGNFRALVLMILDGLREADMRTGLTWKQINLGLPAAGTFYLSLLHARYLSCAGLDSLGMNTYAYIQFAEDPGKAPCVCMSSCCLANPHPEWNEIFTFQLERLHPMTFLSIHFLGTRDTRMQIHLKENVPESGSAEADRLGAAITNDNTVDVGAVEEEPELARRVAGADDATQVTEEIVYKTTLEAERASFPDHIPKRGGVRDLYDRVWLRLKNFHESCRNRGYNNFAMPAVPKDHVPLGAIFISFRTLQECVQRNAIFEYDRPLRMSQQAWCRYDLEFRPRYWKPKDTIDPSELKRFKMPTKKDVDRAEEFTAYNVFIVPLTYMYPGKDPGCPYPHELTPFCGTGGWGAL